MEELNGRGTQIHGIGSAVRKKRSQTFRRRPELQDVSPLSSAPPSEDASKGSSDENNGGDSNSKRKEFNLNQCVIRVSSAAGGDSEKSKKKTQRDDGGFNDFYNTDPGRSGRSNKRSSEGVLAPANWKGVSKAPDGHGGRNGEIESAGLSGVPADGLGLGNKSRVKKVKLKVGSVTRTISTSNGGSESGSSAKNSRQSDSSRSRYKGSPDDVHSSDKRTGLQGIPWKDFSKDGFVFKKEDQLSGKMAGKNAPEKQEDKVEPVRKSKRVPKKRVMDGDFDENEDEELRYLEKLKNSKMHMGFRDDDEGSSKKQQKLASVSDLSAAKPTKDVKKSRMDKGFEDIEYEEEDETGSDREVEGKKKKQKKEFVDTLMDNSKREMTLTTRQRAMQSKDASASGTSTIEFPNGLPPAPPRKQKEKLSEVEQQLKKAEAAQRRRIQNEKAARESEAEAIRKILGQDSNRKKREEKMKKRREELAEEKAANESMCASNCIRWVMGPSGTVVTFPNEMGLPAIFNSGPSSYPPPRENCAGPSCTNPYKYRDSKTKLPLCSLPCYKAVQERIHTDPIC